MKLGLGLRAPGRKTSGSNLLQNALTFNGTTTRVALTSAMSLQSFTIMFWMKGNYNATTGRIVDFRDTNNDGAVVSQTSATQIRALYNTITSNYSSHVDAAWHHYAMVAQTSDDTMRLVVNGSAQSTISIAANDINTTTPGKIGCRAFGTVTEFYRGQLAQVAVFNTGLSAGTIAGIMNKTYSQLSAGDKTNLVSWWALTNISGTSVPDLHGSNHGTLTP